jgi:hypothetical protein
MTDEDCEQVYLLSKHKHHVYLVVGQERGSEGTPHLQCYVVFKKPVGFNSLKGMIPRAHIEVAKGTSEENRKYCMKEDNYEEFGDCPSVGGERAQKDKWDSARALAKAGLFDEIPSELYLRFRSALHAIHDDANAATECIPVLHNLWIYGSTGIGKSKYAWDHFPGAYRKGLNKWFDHYNKQDVVIIEDVDPTHFKWLGSFLKIWSDHYPFMAERKGGSRMIRPKTIVITSNYRIQECLGADQMMLPVIRRFTEKTILDGVLIDIPGNPPVVLGKHWYQHPSH